MQSKYDLIVIGSGPAGHTAAIKGALNGLKVCVIEKKNDRFGGVCLNEGCIPAKSLYHSAKIYKSAKENGNIFNPVLDGLTPEVPELVRRSEEATSSLKKGLEFLFKQNKIDLAVGAAKFLNNKNIEITCPDGKTETITAEHILVASGSLPRALHNVDFDGEHVISSSEAIKLQNVPKSVLVVGGGAIGTEFASYFNILGSEVAIIELEDSLLPGMDKDISKRLASIFKSRNIGLFTSSNIKTIEKQADGVNVTISSNGEETIKAFEIILVAVGRIPQTEELGLDKTGVELCDKGFIKVDDSLRTAVADIFAAGDVIKTPMLAHTAQAEGELVVNTIIGKIADGINYDNVPNVVYTDIEVASVGKTEEALKSDGTEYKTSKYLFKVNGRAVANRMTEGFVKVLADKNSKKILGAHIIGDDAAELIHEFVVAKHSGVTLEEMSSAVYAHPTLSETSLSAIRAVSGENN